MISNVMTRVALTLLIASFSLAECEGEDTQIDELLSRSHERAAISATDRCDDATYIRRLSLDLIGRVPTTGELEQFLSQPNRADAVDRLLDSNEHPRFWSHLWTTMLVGRGDGRGVESEVLRRWVEQRLSDGTAISQLAFQLLTAQGVSSLDGPVSFVVASRQDPVMRLSRTFLSVQLDCAQCHDHPHERWTNEDYRAMQRFYQPTQYREVSGGVAVTDSGPDPRTEKPVFLTGRQPQTSAWRRELGLMVVQSKPFSRAMVNRTWHWLMGRGIVDPVDGLSRDNPAAVPELLDQLASEFRASRFQLRPLIRKICTSEAYQRNPAVGRSADAQQQLRLFAARNVRAMLPEQWIASTAIVLDRPLPEPADLALRARQILGLSRQDAPATDPFEWTATTQTLIRQLSGDLPAPIRDLDAMFLATVARRPSSEERRLVQSENNQDTLFALVHSNEFIMND